jgi:hypothetical protein
LDPNNNIVEDRHAQIFLEWERRITEEWRRGELRCKALGEDPQQAFRNWVVNKMVALFTWNQINSEKIKNG